MRVDSANTKWKGIQQVSWIHTLTANEKTNGITIQLTTSARGYDAGSCVVENKQIVFEWA